MELTLYQVDAFTDRVFHGNPAAVCALKEWLPAPLMQSIAEENNLSESAFLVGDAGSYEIRWFTPNTEVDLCGHATLASAFVLFNWIEPTRSEIRFHSKSGELVVVNNGDTIALDFPAIPGEIGPLPPALSPYFRGEELEYLYGDCHTVVLGAEAAVREFTPPLDVIRNLPGIGLVVTARGDDADFVSRFFAPQLGIDEDPVTGATHCTLVPYWANRLGKSTLFAKQLSRRGGALYCEDRGERVSLAGKAALYMQGSISLP